MKNSTNGAELNQPPARKPGTFQKGDPRINRTKGPGGKRGNLSPLLRDMRWVYGRPEVQDRTPGQKHCRQWLKSDPKGFLSKLADLEKTFASGSAKNAAVADSPPATEQIDEGTERCLALVERLLAEWQDQEQPG